MPTWYKCTKCGCGKWVDVRPSSAEYSINTGCEVCGRIVRFERPGFKPRLL